MAFAPVPNESKRAINRAAQEIVEGTFTADNFELISKWRACHAYPINTFQSTLRHKIRNYPDEPYCRTAFKKDGYNNWKVKEDRSVTLTTMQDIGGVRAILKSVRDVNRLAEEYSSSPYFRQHD